MRKKTMEKRIAKLEEALRSIAHGPVGYWCLPEHRAEVIRDFMKTAEEALKGEYHG